MIDDFDLMPATNEPFDPLSVVLFKALQVLAFLFFIALLVIWPEHKDGKVDNKAEFLVTMSWRQPSGRFRHLRPGPDRQSRLVSTGRDAGFMVLDRDDRGGANDFILVNGEKVPSPIRQETVSIRGIVAGEYTVNLYHFTAMGREPVPVAVKVEKLNPTVQVVYYDTIMLERMVERTAVRFTINDSGAAK